jgi:D-xylose transport system substrate-binding protein
MNPERQVRMKLVKLVPPLVVAGMLLAACGGGGGSGVTLGKKIAFLLPDTQTPRYESQDVPLFTAKLKSSCLDCTVDYRNANQDAAAQLTQAEAALAGGANVLVLDPVDVSTASAIAAKAKGRHVPVIAYDRLLVNTTDLAYFVAFDDSAVGPLQAGALLTALKGKANPNVVALTLGAQDILGAKVTIAKAYDTPLLSPDSAQTEMTDALKTLHNKVDAVYAADDATAGGATAALIAAGIKPFPPITGNGAELKAIQRILVGQQYMTVYKPVRAEAEAAAQLAYDLAYGVALPSSMTDGRILISPVAVTRQTIISTVVADGFWTRADICTAQYVDACRAAGIS